MPSKKALITGITGQDGSYLAELLLKTGYHVAGIIRDKTKLGNIKHLSREIELFEVNLTDFSKLKSAILKSKPIQIYNLGAVTNLAVFSENLSYATKITEGAPHLIFDTALELQKKGYDIRVFQASSCLIFGSPVIWPQNEGTPVHPITPYAEAKLRVDLYVRSLRKNKGLYVCSGILYNHESPRRPLDYVTRKITAAAACIYNRVGKIPKDRFGKPILTKDFKLKLGDISTIRDWGDARDFVRVFLLMLENDTADDYIIATGETHSVQDVLEIAFDMLNLNWRDYVVENESEPFSRFAQNKESMKSLNPTILCGDATKAQLKLSWKPRIKFEDLIKEMVENDVKIFSQ